MKITKDMCRREIERLTHVVNTLTLSLGITREATSQHSVEALSLSRALIEVAHTQAFWEENYKLLLERDSR